MAARATKAVKKTAAQAAPKLPRQGGKPTAGPKKHAVAPSRAVNPEAKPAKAKKTEKPKQAAARPKKAAKASKSTTKPAPKRTTAQTKSAMAASKPKKGTNPVRSAARTKNSVPAKAGAAKKAVPKKGPAKSASLAQKNTQGSAAKTPRAPKQSKKSTKPAGSALKSKVSKKAGSDAAAVQPQKPVVEPRAKKRIRRASRPVPAPAPSAPPGPGRIVAKGSSMAPEPRSPALEKQRLKDALAARELVSKQESLYEKGVAQFNRRKFGLALPMFEQAAEGPQVALRDRARVYAQICRQRTEENKIQLRNAEDYYNYGVKLLNDREFEDAAAHLGEALRRNPKAAHAHYATAVLHALNHNQAGVYDSLKKAIELDPRNRHLALRDSDLSIAKRDPAIFRLLHPNASTPPAP